MILGLIIGFVFNDVLRFIKKEMIAAKRKAKRKSRLPRVPELIKKALIQQLNNN